MKLRAVLLIGLGLLAVIPYLGALDNQFVFDDRVAIAENPSVTGFDLPGIFGSPYWPGQPSAGIYRPLTTLGFALDYAAGKGSPRPFLIMNILLHAAATLLVFVILRRLFPQQESAGWIVAALFAVHPLHVEAVAGIVGRAEVLSAVLTFLCYLAWLRAEEDRSWVRGLLPPLLWFGALLAKESAVMLPALLLLHRTGWLSGTPKGRLRKYDSGWLVAILAALILRAHALGGLRAPIADKVDNPLIQVGPIERALGSGGVLARQLWQTLTGLNLSADYSYAAVRPGAGLYIAGALTFMIGAGIAASIFCKARRSLESWGLSFFLCFWFVTSNLIVPIGTAQADRLFYLPILGLLAAAIAGILRLSGTGRRRFLLYGLFAVLIAAGAARSIDRARDWKNEKTLFESAVQVEPMSVKARWNLSVVVERDEGQRSAERILQILAPVAKLAPDHAGWLLRQASAFMFLHHNLQADSLFRAALRVGTPDSAVARIELGNLALERQDGEAALREFDAAGRAKGKREHVEIGRASALSILKRYRESADVWRTVLAQFPDSIPVRVACAYNLREADSVGTAIGILEEGIRGSQDPRLLNELARAYLAAGRFTDARGLRPSITDPDIAKQIDESPAMRIR